MTDKDTSEFINKLNPSFKCKRESDGGLHIYYDNIHTDVVIFGSMENGTEWTLQTLENELNVFLTQRFTAKIIISKPFTKKKRIRKKREL